MWRRFCLIRKRWGAARANSNPYAAAYTTLSPDHCDYRFTYYHHRRKKHHLKLDYNKLHQRKHRRQRWY